MPDEQYFVVVNDNPVPWSRGPCITGPGDDLDFYRDKQEALDRRDVIREQYDNPDINVYRITIHEGSLEREEVAAWEGDSRSE
jgi:hypothetical protein